MSEGKKVAVSYAMIVVLLLQVSFVCGIIWEPITENIHYSSRRLENTAGTLFRLRGQLSFDNVRISIPLMMHSGEQRLFSMVKSNVLPKNLAQRYPEIKTYVGNDGDTLARLDYSPSAGLRAAIYSKGQVSYIDPIAKDHQIYKVYSAKDMGKPPGEWDCKLHPHNERERTLSTAGNFNMYQFKIVVAANGQYSSFHGNTKSSVLAAIVSLLNRVNGIYERDLGVTFQLHDDNDDAVCLSPCSSLSNTGKVLDEVNGFINGVGISTSSFHIGHVLTTGAGGSAYMGVLCSPNKARGATGTNNPIGDAFYVDYVAHELGHQLYGGHSFTNCDGLDENFSTLSNHEPGSGSTIMSYAGLCSNSQGVSRNLQTFAHPIFSSVNIPQMRSFIVSSNIYQSNCGEVVPQAAVPLPVVNFPKECVIPVANFFKLSGTEPLSQDYYYNIEVVDIYNGPLNFADRSMSRFRTWEPTKRLGRYFPNLYYIVHNLLPDIYDEILSSTDELRTFRLITRSGYNYQNSTGFGSHGIADAKINFTSSYQGLHWATLNYTMLVVGGDTQFVWNVGGTDALSPSVSIYMAHTIEPFDNHELDYSSDSLEPNWVLIGDTANDGFEEMNIPGFHSDYSQNASLILMIRSSDSDSCFFFDIITGIDLVDLRPEFPSGSPSDSPAMTLCDGMVQSNGICFCGCGEMDIDCGISTSELICFDESGSVFEGNDLFCDVNHCREKSSSPSTTSLEKPNVINAATSISFPILLLLLIFKII